MVLREFPRLKFKRDLFLNAEQLYSVLQAANSYMINELPKLQHGDPVRLIFSSKRLENILNVYLNELLELNIQTIEVLKKFFRGVASGKDGSADEDLIRKFEAYFDTQLFQIEFQFEEMKKTHVFQDGVKIARRIQDFGREFEEIQRHLEEALQDEKSIENENSKQYSMLESAQNHISLVDSLTKLKGEECISTRELTNLTSLPISNTKSGKVESRRVKSVLKKSSKSKQSIKKLLIKEGNKNLERIVVKQEEITVREGTYFRDLPGEEGCFEIGEVEEKKMKSSNKLKQAKNFNGIRNGNDGGYVGSGANMRRKNWMDKRDSWKDRKMYKPKKKDAVKSSDDGRYDFNLRNRNVGQEGVKNRNMNLENKSERGGQNKSNYINQYSEPIIDMRDMINMTDYQREQFQNESENKNENGQELEVSTGLKNYVNAGYYDKCSKHPINQIKQSNETVNNIDRQFTDEINRMQQEEGSTNNIFNNEAQMDIEAENEIDYPLLNNLKVLGNQQNTENQRENSENEENISLDPNYNSNSEQNDESPNPLIKQKYPNSTTKNAHFDEKYSKNKSGCSKEKKENFLKTPLPSTTNNKNTDIHTYLHNFPTTENKSQLTEEFERLAEESPELKHLAQRFTEAQKALTSANDLVQVSMPEYDSLVNNPPMKNCNPSLRDSMVNYEKLRYASQDFESHYLASGSGNNDFQQEQSQNKDYQGNLDKNDSEKGKKGKNQNSNTPGEEYNILSDFESEENKTETTLPKNIKLAKIPSDEEDYKDTIGSKITPFSKNDLNQQLENPFFTSSSEEHIKNMENEDLQQLKKNIEKAITPISSPPKPKKSISKGGYQLRKRSPYPTSQKPGTYQYSDIVKNDPYAQRYTPSVSVSLQLKADKESYRRPPQTREGKRVMIFSCFCAFRLF